MWLDTLLHDFLRENGIHLPDDMRERIRTNSVWRLPLRVMMSFLIMSLLTSRSCSHEHRRRESTTEGDGEI